MHLFTYNFLVFSFLSICVLLANRFKANSTFGVGIYLLLSFFVLAILHVGVAINSVADLSKYESSFIDIANARGYNIFDAYRSDEYFFILINKISSLVRPDFRFLLLVYNVFLLFAHFFIARKYSPYFAISIVLFLLFGYNQSLFVLREYLAISILLFSIPFIINVKIIPFLILSIIAFFSHHSSIIWIPLFFLFKITKPHYFIISMIMFVVFFLLLSSDIGKLIFTFNMDAYEAYIADVNIDIKQVMIPILYLAVYVISLRKHIFDSNINKICFIALLIVAIGYIFAPTISQMGRLLQYYRTLSILSIPIALSYIKDQVFKWTFLIIVLVVEGYLSTKGLNEYYFSRYSYEGLPWNYYLLLLLSDIGIIVLFRKLFFISKKR